MEDETRAKILSDHWLHQNTLMWGRLQTALGIQIGLLGAAYTLHTLKWPVLTFLCCLAAATATVALIHISDHDRRVRDKHRQDLENIGMNFGIDFSQQDSNQYQDSALNLKFIGSKFYLRAVLCFLVALDTSAAMVFLFSTAIR